MVFKKRSGIHRLCKNFSFDAAKETYIFCICFVAPVIDDKIEIIIKPEDIRVDTYRASGAGDNMLIKHHQQ